ncbi:CoB-CoM heterodisulfide reductase, subunit D [Desulfocicer vacuolatum DSM 3385]|uniref:CoB-CoM heterodisulfide reductase, subunit D n=1 Tax=Desulfocicer vacuolatum DSM 3385 TaxID=1121400 RepID=A0A1W2D5C9_9BACT|nr:(Fe-S)-binding protein [Desulfocicer vacuolatum]SMC92679.1 CoB-CoM heterodisulfide reductase, subunit D [Desulfocicer vacuolatum DSM 3385]
MAHFNIKEKLQMEACTGCLQCAEICPAVLSSNEICLSGVYRLDQLKKIFRSENGPLKWLYKNNALTSEALTEFADTVYRCTLCGKCQEVCPAGIELKELWISLREHLVQRDACPEKVNMIRDNLGESHNVFDEDNEERADWVEDMQDAPDDCYIRESADVVYFTGCVSSYFPMAQKIPMATVKILDKAGISFTLLGEEEWCCGFPLIGAGLKEHIGKYIRHNIESIRKKGADTVIFACPSCYQMWLEYYPDEFKLYHVTEYMEQLIKEEKISINSLDITVTYHDPCDLGRGAGVYDAPRNVIKAIPGIRLKELPRNKSACQCCGGGGNLEMIDAALSSGIAKQKVDEIEQTGASVLLSACQQCVRTINTYVKRNKVSLDVMDITELIAQNLAD